MIHFITITDAAKSLDITRQNLSELIHGKRNISTEMALRLTSERWLKLQMQYDLWKYRHKKFRIHNLIKKNAA